MARRTKSLACNFSPGSTVYLVSARNGDWTMENMKSRNRVPGGTIDVRILVRKSRHFWGLQLFLFALCDVGFAAGKDTPDFRKDVQPILTKYCYDCHGDGMSKGQVSLDEFKSHEEMVSDHDLWLRVIKNVRGGVMPPEKKPHPTAEEKEVLERWIKDASFRIDPADPDPGRVTVRRLNRTEYRNTIRDLMGIDFNTEAEFPPDDTGHGFDNIGDVLTVSPMLLEKYITAAKSIVESAVPSVSRVVREEVISGRQFTGEGNDKAGGGSLSLSYSKAANVKKTIRSAPPGKYELLVDLTERERFVDGQFDYNKVQVLFKVDGKERLREEYLWNGGKTYKLTVEENWSEKSDHEFAFEIVPLTPDEKQVRNREIRINSVTLRGPLDREHWVRPKNFDRYFTKDAPEDEAARRGYAVEILERFATKAFRRPVDKQSVSRLAALAESVYTQPGKTFENGVQQAMVAVLASPRFLFREEGLLPASPGQKYAEVDDYSLASRLSYFLWSSMPDEELISLAKKNELRPQLKTQFKRMLSDKKSGEFIRNFTGQWLQARDIDGVIIDARAVLGREDEADPNREKMMARFRELRNTNEDELKPEEKTELEGLRRELFRNRRGPRAELNGEIRRAMRSETEMVFEHVIQNDRPLSELLNSDYTFLNSRLARHYGLPEVEGDEMRLVTLPPGSPRGGIITQGTVLAVTSNPTRTSPVKRGLFVLENVLGSPPPPPPPDIPSLEDAAKTITDRTPSLRETLELHRGQPLCSSCHSRMDPIGLGLENFNAMGMWREEEYKQPLEVGGKLITGEEFKTVQELKKILVENHHLDFYHCLTEKLLTYALGRGLEYYDVHTIDNVVARVEASGGKPSALLLGIIESAPFQKRRTIEQNLEFQQRADLGN
jgi:hypothetical protein